MKNAIKSMKNLILIALLLIVSKYSQAQIPVIHTTPPHITPPLDKFAGKWVYKKGDSIFTLVLVKKAIIVKNKSIDLIVGNYKLVVNDKVVVNTLDHESPMIRYGMYHQPGTDVIDTNVIHLSFTDIVMNIGGFARIKIERNDPNKIRWSERYSSDLYMGEAKHKFCLPDYVVLKRQ